MELVPESADEFNSELPDETPELYETLWGSLQRILIEKKAHSTKAAARLIVKHKLHKESLKTLTYRLYNVAERNRWTDEAQRYNTLIESWEMLEGFILDVTREMSKQQTTLEL